MKTVSDQQERKGIIVQRLTGLVSLRLSRTDVSLFLVSLVMLFFEIMMIRWLSSELRIFSYFHNLVLLFAFLGIGIGAAISSKNITPLISVTIATFLTVIISIEHYAQFKILRNISEHLSYATGFFIWWSAGSLTTKIQAIPSHVAVMVSGVSLLMLVTSIVTISFIPFGSLVGRAFRNHENPLRAYGVNLAGSLAGIWFFNLLSLLALPPQVWFAFGGLGSLLFIPGRGKKTVAALLVGLSVVALSLPRSDEGWTLWSPYQKLSVLPAAVPVDDQEVQFGHQILVNSVGYMQITNYSPEFVNRYPSLFPSEEIPYDHYNIPYRFAGKLDRVLIVGTGAGNDTAGALRNGAQRVTAVDIDPVIIQLGRKLHPEAPFDDARVTVVNDDARSFFKRSRDQYDLIVFGLLDSHTLSSSYSNVRLDNYVYTVESFQEARQLLSPDGVLVVLFEVAGSDNYIGARIHRMLAEAFETQPVGFEVRSHFRGWGGTGFVAGNTDVIDRQLASDPRLQALVDQTSAAHRSWVNSPVEPATDDWPYLYLQGRSIPILYFLVLGTLAALAARGVYAAFRQPTGPGRRLDWHFFFLGAGFMLLEVQNVSKLALLFGTTWTVNALVISAILVMILLANYYVSRVRIVSLDRYYAALFASLVLNWLVPVSTLGGLPTGPKELVVSLVMGLPIFFAGVIFSTSFARAQDRAIVLASNLLGSMAGGMLESLSFILGIKALLIVALGLYLLSMLAKESPVRLGQPAEMIAWLRVKVGFGGLRSDGYK